MSLAIIPRFAVSSCRYRIDVDVCRRIVTGLHFAQRRAVRGFATRCDTVYIVHRRLFHHTTLLHKSNLKENKTAVTEEDISTLQIKKRPSKRNRAVIEDDKASKFSAWDVKALATAEEYNLEALAYGLLNQQLYIPSKISVSTNSKSWLHYIIQRLSPYIGRRKINSLN